MSLPIDLAVEWHAARCDAPHIEGFDCCHAVTCEQWQTSRLRHYHPHEHHWHEITAYGDTAHRWICACGTVELREPIVKP